MRLGETLFFLCLATSLHAAVWHVSPIATGTHASGGSGTDTVSVQAASAAQQAMVAEWQRPPGTSTQMPGLQDPQPIMEAAMPATSAAPPVISREMPRLSGPAPAPSTPEIDTTPAEPATATRPRMRPSMASTAAQNRTARQASGTAQHAQSGTGGSDRALADTAQRNRALHAAWGSQIHDKVHRNIRYPRGASSSGTAKLTLTLTPTGNLEDVHLIRSSGDALLDRAALDAVKRAGKFAEAPEGLAEPKYAFSLLLTFAR